MRRVWQLLAPFLLSAACDDEVSAPPVINCDKRDPDAPLPEPVRVPRGSGVVTTARRYEWHVSGKVPSYIPRDMVVQAHEVTRGEWLRIMPWDPSIRCEGGCTDTHPVDDVPWFEVLYYANKLSELEGFEPCYDLSSCTGALGSSYGCDPEQLDFSFDCPGWRLPTPVEWEYAARAGDRGWSPCEYQHYGLDIDETCMRQVAWAAPYEPHQVALLCPNGWGLFDTLGNLGEYTWGSTPFTDEPLPLTDFKDLTPTCAYQDPCIAPADLRGGSVEVWMPVRYGDGGYISATNRMYGSIGAYGFRLVRSLPETYRAP